MCPTLESIENCGRYDMKTKNILDFFLEKGYVSKLKKTKDGQRIIIGKGIFNSITKSYRSFCHLNRVLIMIYWRTKTYGC